MKKIYKISLIGVCCLLALACGSTNKTIAPSASTAALDELVASKQFEINVNWVRPMMTTSMNSVLLSGLRPPGSPVNRIDVSGNGNYLRLNGDEVDAYLPFWGERQMGGGYNAANTGIKFEGVPTDFKVTKNERKQQTTIGFNIKEKAETFRVNITLTPSQNATILIVGSHRNSIWYDGKAAPLEVAEIE